MLILHSLLGLLVAASGRMNLALNGAAILVVVFLFDSYSCFDPVPSA
jgi:hypothetical protein